MTLPARRRAPLQTSPPGSPSGSPLGAVVESSGEDSNPGKWGWQIEPWVGFEPSAESMFITPSTGHDPLKVASNWRKSLAVCEYTPDNGLLKCSRHFSKL